ncbi:hypothetical protein D3C76_379180 [compost metagenome]
MIKRILFFNGGFELDQNNNKLPDLWETVWRNGSSTVSSVSRQGYDPIGGAYHLRMYNGTGDSKSFVYGRLKYILLSNGKIVSLNYDKNGSLLKKETL